MVGAGAGGDGDFRCAFLGVEEEGRWVAPVGLTLFFLKFGRWEDFSCLKRSFRDIADNQISILISRSYGICAA